MPVRIFLSAGTVHDVKYGEKPIEGIDAAYLLADRGYDSDKLILGAKMLACKGIFATPIKR
jgi:hypothetical protein